MVGIHEAVQDMPWKELVEVRSRPEVVLFAMRVQGWVDQPDDCEVASVLHAADQQSRSRSPRSSIELICDAAARIESTAVRLVDAKGKLLERDSRCDILIVIPLIEEFRTLLEMHPDPPHESDDGLYYYRLEINGYNVLALAISDTVVGPTVAGQIAEKALSYAKPRVCFLVGIAGCLEEDLLLGDVVVASEVCDFLAGSKAQPSADGGYVLEYSGNHWPLEFAARTAVESFELSAPRIHSGWLADAARYQRALALRARDKKFAHDVPKVAVGHVASGPTVGGATAYTAELHGIDRKFLALETEGEGVVQAGFGRVRPVPTYVVRGLSDFADERKKKLDGTSSGVWRRYAMHNAATFVHKFIESEAFATLLEGQ